MGLVDDNQILSSVQREPIALSNPFGRTRTLIKHFHTRSPKKVKCEIANRVEKRAFCSIFILPAIASRQGIGWRAVDLG
jgi:hypothetical protein